MLLSRYIRPPPKKNTSVTDSFGEPTAYNFALKKKQKQNKSKYEM